MCCSKGDVTIAGQVRSTGRIQAIQGHSGEQVAAENLQGWPMNYAQVKCRTSVKRWDSAAHVSLIQLSVKSNGVAEHTVGVLTSDAHAMLHDMASQNLCRLRHLLQ